MPGRAATRPLIVLGLLAVIWLALSGAGLLDFGDPAADGDAGMGRDPLAELEDQLFAQMQQDPGLRGMPGMERRFVGVGVLKGKVLVHVPGVGLKPLPDVHVHVVGRTKGKKQHLPDLVTQADGTFTFTHVPAGLGYVLLLDHAPYRRIALRGLTIRADTATDVGVLVLGAPTSLTGEVVDAKGRSIAGARVQVVLDSGRRGSIDMRRALFELNATIPVLAEAGVNAEGRFVLQDIGPGRYVLRVSAPGYATTFKSDVLVTLDENSSAVRVVLDPGAGFFGKVTDEAGRGLAGARVIAVSLPGRNLERFDRIEVVTDGDGSYRLDRLVSGMTYGMEAWAEGYAPTGSYVREISGMKRRDWKLPSTGRVEGRVTDAETGVGIADCQVTVLAGPLHGASPVSTTTDAAGGFVLPHVNPGPIMLFSAKAAGYQPGDQFNLAAVKGLRVVANDTTWVDWTLDAGGAVTGRVTSGAGRPVPYASVALVDRSRRRQRLTGEITALGDADGRYHLVGVQPGDYDIRVTAAGYAPPTAKEMTHVHMRKDLAQVVKDVTLARGATVEGSVLSPDGQPVRGARVWIEAADGTLSQDSLRDLVTVSGGGGGFSIPGVPPTADVFVYAEHDGYVKSAGERLKLTPGQARRANVTLRAGVKLPGRVVDVRGVGVAGARLRWGNVDGVRERDLRSSFEADEHLGSRVVRTDDDGGFALTALPPGKLLLKVEKQGFSAWYRRDLMIGEEGLQPALTIELEATLTVSGRVTGSDTGRGLARAFVYARERSPGEGQAADEGRVQAVVSTETDARGYYVLGKVPPGVHDIVVWFAEGYVGAAQDWRHEKVRKKDVAAGAKGVDFALDRPKPPEEAPAGSR